MVTEQCKRALLFVWDALFPPRCPLCGAYTDEVDVLCGQCLCRILDARRLPLAAGSPLTACFAAARYGQSARRLLKEIKYGGKRGRCTAFTRLLESAPLALPSVDMAVPVPLHEERLARRGYNQTAEIFRPWCASHRIAWRENLRRTRPTRPQYELLRYARQQNVADAFCFAGVPEEIKSRRVLLVDDIFTTGATMNECARVLKEAGASRVYGLAVASDAG